MSDPVDISRLRDLAREALQGEGVRCSVSMVGGMKAVVCDPSSVPYLGAMSPDVTTALLDRLERAEKLSEAMSLKARLVQEAHEKALERVASLEAQLERAENDPAWPGQERLLAAIDRNTALLERVASLEAERDEARDLLLRALTVLPGDCRLENDIRAWLRGA